MILVIEQKYKKRAATDASLTKRPPTQEERFLIHDLFLEYSAYDDPQSKIKKPDNIQWMADTKMSAIHIMQPQDRNIHDKVLAGFAAGVTPSCSPPHTHTHNMKARVLTHFCVCIPPI